LKLPEDLQVKLLAPKQAHFLGNAPAFVIPMMLLLVWSTIIVVLVYERWKLKVGVQGYSLASPTVKAA